MKKALSYAFVLILAAAPAFAEDIFLTDFNLYAEPLFGIQPIKAIVSGFSYKSDSVEIMVTGQETTIIGESPLDVISASCCVLRCIDNEGSMIDQYGRVMFAYFLNRTKGIEARATTESGVLIYFSEASGIYTARLVR